MKIYSKAIIPYEGKNERWILYGTEKTRASGKECLIGWVGGDLKRAWWSSGSEVGRVSLPDQVQSVDYIEDGVFLGRWLKNKRCQQSVCFWVNCFPPHPGRMCLSTVPLALSTEEFPELQGSCVSMLSQAVSTQLCISSALCFCLALSDLRLGDVQFLML